MEQRLRISNICVSCDICRVLCPEQTIFTQDNEYHIEPWGCTLCNVCVQICPVDAIKPTVKEEK